MLSIALFPSLPWALYATLLLGMAAWSPSSAGQAAPTPPTPPASLVAPQTPRASLVAPQPPPASLATPQSLDPPDARSGTLQDWAGLQVTSISFDGVSAAVLDPLPSQLDQQPGTPLDPVKVRASLRTLYATGLYQTIAVAGVRTGDSVSIIFSGVGRLFIGRVNVDGVKDDRLAAVLQSATQLQPGAGYSEAKADEAEPIVNVALQNNGYFGGQIARTTVIDRQDSLVDLNFEITPGNPARVGDVELTGDSGPHQPPVSQASEAKTKF